MNISRLTYIVIILVVFLVGCSSNSSIPITPHNQAEEFISPLAAKDIVDYESNRTLLGMWSLNFNVEDGTASLNDNRSLNAHYNITGMLPFPSIDVISYDPLTGIYDIDVTIANPYSIDGYDLRLIVFTNDNGIRLMNPDNWTSLYDIPGGAIINPFKAYAKHIIHRKFKAFSEHTERCQFYLPSGSGQVNIAIDVSFPSNCIEPYQIKDFKQHGELNASVTSYVNLTVNVYDWQNDINEVKLYCPEILGAEPLSFLYFNDNRWSERIYNNNCAPMGEYFGYISATSENSGQLAIYEFVTICVTGIVECLYDYNDNPSEATPVSYNDHIVDCVGRTSEATDYLDYFVFYTPPAGLESATIDLSQYGGDEIEITTFGSNPDTPLPGIELSTDFHIELADLPYSRYIIKIYSPGPVIGYELVTEITSKLSNIECDIYVATDDGTETGTWPIWEVPDPDEELTIEHLDNLVTWANSIWNQYSINLVWDQTVTIMSDEFYNLTDDSAMHDTYGKTSGKISLYFVNQCAGNTAYCKVFWPEWSHTVGNTFTVYSPSVWFWEEAVAHEHGHAFGYLFDMYLYDQAGCECGDNDCLGTEPNLYYDPDACYAGNLMWYSMGFPWDQYDMTYGQYQWVCYFNYHFPDNFPFY